MFVQYVDWLILSKSEVPFYSSLLLRMFAAILTWHHLQYRCGGTQREDKERSKESFLTCDDIFIGFHCLRLGSLSWPPVKCSFSACTEKTIDAKWWFFLGYLSWTCDSSFSVSMNGLYNHTNTVLYMIVVGEALHHITGITMTNSLLYPFDEEIICTHIQIPFKYKNLK